MGDRLKDKVAIITGGSSGIGRETALRFAREGAKVAVADRNRGAGEETVRLAQKHSADVIFVTVNVSDAEQVSALVAGTTDRFGRLDVLVNAAGVLIRTPPLAEVDPRDWDLMMETNLKGLFLCCKYAIPAMLRGGGGSIVNISSQGGVLGGYGISLPYSVTKAGVIHLSTVAAAQYARQGIRINSVTPGIIDTPQFRGSSASTEAFAEWTASHPMGRAGRAEEVANLILFLASDEASYISGSTYSIDGAHWASAR